MPDKKRREVIESPRYTKERNLLQPDVARMDEILDGVVWVLSEDPTVGRKTPNPAIWAMPTIAWNTVPLVVYYSFNENQVVLESIIKAISDN